MHIWWTCLLLAPIINPGATPVPSTEMRMDGVMHIHTGKAGVWTISILQAKAADGGYSASAEIGLKGRCRCKLVLTAPELSAQAGHEKLKQKCIDWINEEETKGNDLSRSAEAEEA